MDKKVLIIGKGSYIGSHISEYLSNYGYCTSEFDVEHNEIKDDDFKNIDIVIHVAAIVHRKDIKEYDLYKKINVDLVEDTALKAKKMELNNLFFLVLWAFMEKIKA
jgi:UDP-glucose 4-epimerase